MPGAQAGGVGALRGPIDALPDPLPLPPPPKGPWAVDVRPPGSKSITNRALVLAGLAKGRSILRGALVDADDPLRLMGALERLGARVRADGDTITVQGVGGRWRTGDAEPTLNLGNAGTATRFMAASAALADGPVVIDGSERMRARPIADLADALRALGAQVEFLDVPGFCPLRIRPGPVPPAPAVALGDLASSQFVSGLMLLGPWIPGGVTLRLTGRIASASYIAMTASLLGTLGADVRSSDDLRVIRVGGRPVDPFDLQVEADASGATYFWGAAALVPGSVCRVKGIPRASVQGDAQFPRVLASMGATAGATMVAGDLGQAVGVRGTARLVGVVADMEDMPDAVMTLAVVASFAQGPTTIHGVRTLRVKECDRIDALRRELGRIGVRVDGGVMDDEDTITVTPPPGGVDCSPGAEPVVFRTYDDHRMAMSLALVGLRRPSVLIADPGCVRKTYPGFWRDFATLLEP